MKSKAIIVIYLTGYWERFHRRVMLEALARNASGWANVLCVNPVCSLRELGNFRALGDLLKGKLQQIHSNLFVLTPCIFVPGIGRYGIKSGPGRWIVARQIQRALTHIGASGQILAWFYRPEQIDGLGLVLERLIVIEYYDEYSLAVHDGSPIPGMDRLREEFLSKSNIVFATSPTLFQKLKLKHPHVYLTPNGVDFSLFGDSEGTSCPAEVFDLPSPKIGYVGSVSEFLDLELVEYLVASTPKWSFVLIGPIQSTVKAQVSYLQQRYRNVHFLGRKQHRDLPNYLQDCDVLILPFKTNAYLQRSNPLVLWECLATGRPIVVTDLPIARSLSDVLFVAADRNDFASKIRLALDGNHSARIRHSVEIAREHDWSLLTLNMLKIVKSHVDMYKDHDSAAES